uniref:DNA-binding transcriptional regulator, LysR family n=1 Tax=Candidatus Kentrum sp. MB TaxID=2138164 RepID=A0A450Y2X0_9GAMM|nr:MAG: DNA-binding transcriptional regulator, LysR family [Candidatus Kentron sp. MB]VFK35883.1 MAG: DNA-binding transcriptional regulator, LysR family [Candidatus Kentron sp. MB]VFK77532.1 MAG: DNA-binding transcriptional regulator, LysR family [Candidatus Kentron sp. MB]
MPDRRLQVFHTVAKMLSFTRAAEALHMTQPAVTFQVHQLEEHFDTPLFDRSHHRIRLTDAGKAVYDHADKISRLYAQMENRVRDITGQAGNTVLLGASPMIAEYLLPLLLKGFRNIHPQAIIHLRVANTDQIISMVEHNEIDLGIVEDPVAHKNLIVERCRIEPCLAILPPQHELADRESIPASALLDYPHILREGDAKVILEYLKAAELDTLNLDIAMELASFQAIKGAIEVGLGVSILPRAVVMRELSSQTLIATELNPPLKRALSFVYRKQQFRVQIIDELLDFARDRCQRDETHHHPQATSS